MAAMLYLRKIVLFFLCCLVILLLQLLTSHIYGEKIINMSPVVINPKCQSVLDEMVYGSWNVKTMTLEEKAEMKKFLEISRTQHGLPKSLQRNDSSCGNISFPPTLSPTITWFRALCDEYGSAPCCYNNKCMYKTIDECKCDDCFDMRQPPHAEYSKWIPRHDRCPVRLFDHNEACDLLNGATLYLSGDSYIRHIYTEFLLFLRNNTHDGALKPSVSKYIYDKCTGMYMFTEMDCRLNLDLAARNLCGGNITLMYGPHIRSQSGKNLLRGLNRIVDKPRSFLLFGIGLHNQFNTTIIGRDFMMPAINMVKNHTWPKLLWATPHSPGILKNGNIQSQAKPTILKFMSEVHSLLSPLGIPIFNTYNMTEGMMSFDGNHYGLGMNYWKIQIILNYIQELKDKGDW